MKQLLRRFRQPWNDKTASLACVTTLLLAGCATLATFQSATYSSDALLAQTELANCWSYYQAKSIKQHIFELHRDLLPLLPDDRHSALIARYDSEIDRYRQEKYALLQEATERAQAREFAHQHASHWGNALLLWQVGVLFSSLASVNRITYYWYGALLTGIGGLIALLLTISIT